MLRNPCKFFVALLLLMQVCPNAFAQFGEPTVPPGAISKKENPFRLLKEGTDLIDQHRYEEALAKLKRSVELEPTLYQAKLNESLALAKLGRNEEATDILKSAIKEHPEKDDADQLLISIYLGTGNLSDAISEYRQLADRLPAVWAPEKSPAAIGAITHQIDIFNKVKSTSPKDYYVYATASGTNRWPQSPPVKVFIPSDDSEKSVAAYPVGGAAILKDAFDQWSNATGGVLKFEIVSDPKAAKVDCRWTASREALKNTAENGEAHVEAKNYFLQKATVTMLTSDDGVAPFAGNELKRTALHEVGHAIGLMGHSPEAADIMYPFAVVIDSEPKLSERDQQTIKKLYMPKY